MKRSSRLPLASFSVSFGLAQRLGLKFRHLLSEHGVWQTHVISLKQALKGFIWSCVQNGLNKLRYTLPKHVDFQRNIIAMAPAGNKEMCLETQMDDYISKPIKLESLPKTLGEMEFSSKE
jgi:hypothetical protein